MGLTSFTNLFFFYVTFRFLVDGIEEFIIQPTAWYYVRYLEQSNLFLGFLLSAFSVGALIFAPCFGALNIRIQAPKIILLVCCVTKLTGNILYLVSVDGYFPLIGRFMSGIGGGTLGVLYAVIAQGTNNKYRGQAFLYFEGVFTTGTSLGPMVGSLLTFNFDIFGLTINPGNSPGLIMVAFWFLLLILTAFLPNDLIGKKEWISTGTSSEENESNSELTVIDGTTAYSISRICCLYFLIFQSWVLKNVVLFQIPLLAVHQAGLGLVEINLIYANGALFCFVLLLTAYVFSAGYLAAKSLIAIGIVSNILPLSILFYFALSWNDSQSTNNAYLLLISTAFVNVLFVFPLACSLLSKETPANKASLYQSIAYTVLHLALVVGRVIAGATFNRTGMMFVGVGLAIGLFVELTWFLKEYSNLHPASKTKN